MASNDESTNQPQRNSGRKRISNWDKVITSLAAGAIAGAAAKTVIAPLDRTKINFQTSHSRFSPAAALKFIKDTYKNEGFISLWRGNSATLTRIVPYAAIQFSSHEQWKSVLGLDEDSTRKTAHGQPAHLLHFVAGSLAGITAQSLTYPLDTARARLAVATRSQYKNLRDTFSKIVQQEGFMALYRGYVATMLGVIPYAGFSFFTYETCKKLHAEKFGGRSPAPWERMIFGAIAGAIGQTSSYPLDIVRRRLQVGGIQGEVYGGGILRILLKVYREEGLIHGVFKGLSMNWVKGPIAVGISFTLFDVTQSGLRQLLIRDSVPTNST